MSEAVIFNKHVAQRADHLSKQAVSYINAFGMVAGLIASNIWDLFAGGIVVAKFFGAPIDLGNFTVHEGIAGGLISLGLWFIQLLLWRTVLQGGIHKEDIPTILLAIAVGIADTNIDTSAVFVWMANPGSFFDTLNSFNFLGIQIGEVVLRSLLVALYIMGGFGEMFNALYFQERGKKDTDTSTTPAAPRTIYSSRPAKPHPGNISRIQRGNSQASRGSSSLDDLVSPNLRGGR